MDGVASRPLPGGAVCFGVHLLIDGYRGDPARLADAALMREVLDALPRELRMHPIAEPLVVAVGPQNRKDPGGVSGFVMIAESHLSLHSFPARGFLSADVYTCQDTLDAEAVTRRIGEAFGLEQVEAQAVRRGLRYPAEDLHPGFRS